MKRIASRLAAVALSLCVSLCVTGCIGVPASSSSSQTEMAKEVPNGQPPGISAEAPDTSDETISANPNEIAPNTSDKIPPNTTDELAPDTTDELAPDAEKAASPATSAESFAAAAGKEVTNSQEIALFAENIKSAVAAGDLNAFAGLCGYPVYISSPEGDGEEIRTKKELLALHPDQLFTEKLKADVAAVNAEQLEEYGAGVMLGQEGSIVFSRVGDDLMITGINP